MNPPQAFDPLASTYDSDFTNTAIGRYLRGRVQARLEQHFRAGDHVLELGCGTGEDARWLAGRGVAVLATDASAAMLDITRAKAAGNSLVQVARLDISALTPRPPLPQGEGAKILLHLHLKRMLFTEKWHQKLWCMSLVSFGSGRQKQKIFCGKPFVTTTLLTSNSAASILLPIPHLWLIFYATSMVWLLNSTAKFIKHKGLKTDSGSKRLKMLATIPFVLLMNRY